MHGKADSLSRIPYPNCKRTDCPDCKSRSSSSHAAAKTDKNDVISLISVASFQNDMKDDLPDCKTSNWLDSWTHNDLVEMQRNDPILSKFITLKQTYDTKPGKEIVENCHLELSLLVTKWDLFVLDNELLKYKWHTQNAVQLLLVALQIIRKKFLKSYIVKNIQVIWEEIEFANLLKKDFNWIGIDSDVGRWCRECDNFARGKPGPDFTKSPLQQSLVGWPLDTI